MSEEKEETKNPLEELQKNLQDAFKQGKVFMPFGTGPMGGMGATSKPASGGSESDDEPDPEHEEALNRIREFNLKPKEIRDYLDRFVIQQREAKKVISVAICDHYNHVRRCIEDPNLREIDYAKQNIILLGPTGVGKTYLMRNVAKLIGVPFVKADATKFSETGYVGGDVDDLVRDLVKNANGDTELAQYGIIYIDEIDKIANKQSNGGRDVSGRGVQINLLKLMEETEVNLQSQTDIMGQMQAMMDMQQGGKPKKRTLSTKHVLFIVSGAFDKLEENVKKRLTTSSMGFGVGNSDDNEEDSYLDDVETRDYIEYGFEPEFIGRLPIRVACKNLKPDDLMQILTNSEGSILKQYISDFAGYDINLGVSNESLRKVAEEAYKEKTGARGLMTVLERIFRNFKFELPSTSIKRFEVDLETVENPDASLKKLIKENLSDQRNVLKNEIDVFAQRFKSAYNFDLAFNDDAIETLVDESIDTDRTIRVLCENKFRDFHHGLTLISRNTGQKKFDIDGDVIKDPEKALSQWVVASYRQDESTTPKS